MKNKILIMNFIVIFIALLTVNTYKVQAVAVDELDPKAYITLPQTLNIENEVGTGTISLSSEATGYAISYQKINITKESYDKIKTKNKELSDHKGKDETEYKRLEKEYLDMLPNYTDSWIQTTGSNNNVSLDLKGLTGTSYIALWVKISKGADTYYDFNTYSIEIKNNVKNIISDNSSSDIKFTLKKSNFYSATIEVSGLPYPTDNRYYLTVTFDNNKPELPDSAFLNDEFLSLTYDEASKVYKTLDPDDKITTKVEQNKDLYASLVESVGSDYNILTYGNKLTRYEEPKYSDAFSATFMDSDDIQIVTNFTHSKNNTRELEVKVGKITDTALLQKIKNEDLSGFSDLLSLARSDTGIYDQILPNKESTAIGYASLYGGTPISLNRDC